MRFALPSSNRRVFMLQAATATAALAGVAAAQAAALVAESDPQAKALGYVADASKLNSAKQAKHKPGQNCSNCALYQPAGAQQGGCPLFAGKAVSSKAWCTAYAPKA